MTKRRDVEGPVHRSIIAYLRTVLIGAVIHHSANEIPLRGANVARAIAKAKWNGSLPGYPDIIVHWNGQTVLFEVKAPKGYLSPAQKLVRADLEAQGIKYGVVRSIDDTTVYLSEWGLI